MVTSSLHWPDVRGHQNLDDSIHWFTQRKRQKETESDTYKLPLTITFLDIGMCVKQQDRKLFLAHRRGHKNWPLAQSFMREYKDDSNMYLWFLCLFTIYSILHSCDKHSDIHTSIMVPTLSYTHSVYGLRMWRKLECMEKSHAGPEKTWKLHIEWPLLRLRTRLGTFLVWDDSILYKDIVVS